MLPWGLRALHRDPGKYHSTSSPVQGHIHHLNATAGLELSSLLVIPCLAKGRRIGWNWYQPLLSCSPTLAVSRRQSPQNLMPNGVVSYLLTLQSTNTEGKNKQEMSQTKESSIYQNKPHLYSRDPKRAFVSRSPTPTMSLRDFLEMAHYLV